MSDSPDEPPPLTDEEVLGLRVKAELRKRLRGLRKTSTLAACSDRSRRIIESLGKMAAFRDAKSVALFWPIVDRREVDLRELDASLRARGVDVAYPAIDPDTRVMTFRWVADPAHLEERGMGFQEPHHHDSEEARDVQVIVVPAIAIDPRGHRIGYGAGYYDRALPNYRPPAIAIGVAYDYQLVMEVPASAHDVALDFVVTDARVIDPRDA